MSAEMRGVLGHVNEMHNQGGKSPRRACKIAPAGLPNSANMTAALCDASTLLVTADSASIVWQCLLLPAGSCLKWPT